MVDAPEQHNTIPRPTCTRTYNQVPKIYGNQVEYTDGNAFASTYHIYYFINFVGITWNGIMLGT